MILLDTHILVRYAAGDRKLGKKALAAIERALRNRALLVSSISFWEIAMLVQKGKLKLSYTPMALRALSLQQGIAERSVDGEIGIRSAELASMHPDPADRLIVATAILSGATLVTSDAQILDVALAGLRTQTGSA